MTFTEGQVVVVSDPATLYTSQYKGMRAVVTSIVPHESYPYELTFANGSTLGFQAEELSALDTEDQDHDEVNHPSHYTWLPSGLEVIDVTEHFNFSLGNALKYIMRAGHKHDSPTTDLRKAVWYLNREIERLEASK
ncbi:DUF3310 domain-containing protein [Streptomyces longwoodensis]